MALNLKEPEDIELRARITVFGVGGAGGNAVNNMIEKQLPGVEFIAANTDAQALSNAKAPRKIQLGTGVTRGLGAGSKPDVGYSAAEETIDEIAEALDGSHMCFVTAGMGGGTGTGAAPVVSRIAREMGILTVGVVTKPFHFEGTRRMQLAEMGVAEMQKVVDTLIVIPNQNLFQVASERTTFVEAFIMADDVLYQGVQGVTDLMIRPGMINLDFADVKSVMEEMGKAMMGTGEAEGETRAVDAAEKAIANPLLDEVSLKGARGVLINITGGYDLTLFEMDEAANRIKEEVDPNALIKFGSAIDPEMEGKMRVSVVATGIDAESMEAQPPEEDPAPRRRPVETDASMISAVRGKFGGGHGGQPGDASRAQAPAEPQQRRSGLLGGRQAILRGRGQASQAAAAGHAVAEVEPEPAVAAPQPAPAPRASAPAPAMAPGAPADPAESEAAVAPSPGDMRARAEQVRRRALEARAKRPAEDRAARLDDDEGLFDLDAGSLDAGSLDMPAAQPRASRADPDAGTSAGAADRRQAEPETARAGLFTINRLIHKVAGTGASEPRIDPLSASGPAVRGDQDDDDESEIPAFLRRQAN